MYKHALPGLGIVLAAQMLGAAPAPPSDKDKIQGTWRIESVESGGALMPQENYKQWTFNIKDDKLTIKVGERVRTEYTIKIDDNKKPKTLDLTREVGGRKLIELGIYELDGDTWRMCNDEAGIARPTEFGTKEGTRLEIVILKRVKQ